MKKIFTIICIIISVNAISQTGYGLVGTSALVENKVMNNSISIGGGYKFGRTSAGILADFYGIDKDKGRFVVAAVDIRGYLWNKNKSPYVSLQPGYVLYNRTDHNITTKGSFAGAAVAGFEFKPKEVGFNVSIGYQYTSFKSLGTTVKGNAFKANISLAL